MGEVAHLFGVLRNTVRGWLKTGLVRLGEGKPLLVHGSELQRFLVARRNSARRPCGPGKLYCVRCRAGRAPAGRIAEFTPLGVVTGNLCADCTDCSAMMYRRIRVDQVAALFLDTDIQFRQADSRLNRIAANSAECDIGTGKRP